MCFVCAGLCYAVYMYMMLYMCFVCAGLCYAVYMYMMLCMCFVCAGLCYAVYMGCYTKVPLDMFFVVFTLLLHLSFQFAMCFGCIDCPVLCFVAVLSNHCFSV